MAEVRTLNPLSSADHLRAKIKEVLDHAAANREETWKSVFADAPYDDIDRSSVLANGHRQGQEELAAQILSALGVE